MRINGQYVLVHLPVRRMSKSTSRESLAALTLGAMGVVYGDIGTSPLYTMKEVFSPATGIPLDQAHLIGAVSVIFWGLMMVVTLKYVMLILRADNRGEGGIMALTALAVEAVGAKAGKRLVLLLLGVFGAALFYGDSVITPAISVLSAVEGLEVVTPTLKPFVLPICAVVLIALFAVQRFGTGLVGKLFGPISIRSGSTSPIKPISLGRPPTLWWLLIVLALLVPLSITSG